MCPIFKWCVGRKVNFWGLYLHDNLVIFMPLSKLPSTQTSKIYFKLFHCSLFFPELGFRSTYSKLDPCLIVIPIADCGSSVVFHMDYCDVFVPEQTNTAVSWKLVSSFAANKFKAPPALISTWEFRVDLASQSFSRCLEGRQERSRHAIGHDGQKKRRDAGATAQETSFYGSGTWLLFYRHLCRFRPISVSIKHPAPNQRGPGGVELSNACWINSQP